MPSERFSDDRSSAFRLADTVTAGAMQVGSMLRSARIFHPDGLAHRVRVTVRPPREEPGVSPFGVAFLDRAGSYEGVARFSRGASVPEPLPDILGLALRIEDAHGPDRHQDLLVGSSLEVPLGRQLLVPTIGFRGTTLSSVLPYRLGSAGVFWLGARITDRSGAALVHLNDLDRAIDEDDLRLELRLARRFGAWRSFADVEVGERLSDEESDRLAFNVDVHTGGGVAPAGFFQALRRSAYTASQIGRGS